MNKLEILAPAGSMESVTAAVRSGADAVYIGARQFSARAAAQNFSDAELKSAVEYCHARGAKVHLALNTLIKDNELDRALETLYKACKLPIDAVIVQDVGFASLVKKSVPDLPLHGSTQMSVHTPSGAKLLYDCGFKRAVLSRELSIREIEEIRKSCPIELEVFVHGALCMSVSGQCYLSAMLGGRSGNRGQCAQPCRLPFTVKGGSGFDLSLKDMSALEHLRELEQLGVASAKIEGRMKRPEYVACAVQAARQYLDTGCADETAVKNLRSVFSRSGFTDGYYSGRLGKEMFGTRQKDDVTAATNKVLNHIKNSCKNEIPRVPVSLCFTLNKNEGSIITVCDEDGNSITVYGDKGQPAINLPLTEEKALLQLKKTGGTPFWVNSVNCSIESGITLPTAEINRLRRQAFSALEEKRQFKKAYKINQININKEQHLLHDNNNKLRAYFPDTDIPSEFLNCEFVYIPISSPANEITRLINLGFNLAVVIPRAMFGIESITVKKLKAFKQLGISHCVALNLGAVKPGLKLGFTVHGGFGLNIMNTHSLNFLEELGLDDAEVSFELTAQQINRLGGSIKRGAVVYGHLPLMITRNCPVKNSGISCEKCGKSSVITDRKNIKFPLRCSNGCTELLNSVPLYMGDKMKDFSTVDYKVMMFTVENYVERVKILEKINTETKLNSGFTRGLYYRGVL